MNFVSLLLILIASLCRLRAGSGADDKCIRPALDTSVFQEVRNNGGCILLEKACADDGMLVLFDTLDLAENLTRRNPHGELMEQSGLWNFPARGGANSDALVGHQHNSYIPIRSASRMEAAPHLQHPVFSSCTLPVIMTTDWPYNMHEVLAQLSTIVDVYFRQKGMIDDLATLVLATPSGLSMTPFHHAMLSPFSRFPSISFHELSSRHLPAAAGSEGHHRAAWSQEGSHVRCFERAVLCKLHGFPEGIAPFAAELLKHAKAHIPVDPLGFSTEGAQAVAAGAAPGPPVSVHDDTTLRVLIESRAGPTRNIRNLTEVVEACEAANAAGFRAGSFTRLSCKILHTADTPELHGTARFYTTLGAVRSAHVLVAIHGAGASNCFFMEEDNGGTALLEIRPCRFGTQHCGWPDAYMQVQLTRAGEVIRFFSLNVEDPAQCSPSDYEAAALASPHNTPMRGADDMRARDQHVTLRPASLLAMLRHVGSLLRNESGYQEAKKANRLHGYAVPEGLALGPLCVKDVSAHVRGGVTVLQ